MSHRLSPNDILEFDLCIGDIFNCDCPRIDLGNRNGLYDYIDYLKMTDLDSNAIMKGFDSVHGDRFRKFIVFKALVEFSNGLRRQTLTTFFQRFYDNDTLYMCCGNNHPYLLNTTGGATLTQVKFLKTLLRNREYIFGEGEFDSNDIGLNSDILRARGSTRENLNCEILSIRITSEEIETTNREI